jgi:hypothetical protein
MKNRKSRELSRDLVTRLLLASYKDDVLRLTENVRIEAFSEKDISKKSIKSKINRKS